MTDTDHTRTFGELRSWMLQRLRLRSHLEAHWEPDSPFRTYWNEINDAEFKLGYDHKKYLTEGSPQLCEMRLLTDAEMLEWKTRFHAVRSASKPAAAATTV